MNKMFLLEAKLLTSWYDLKIIITLKKFGHSLFKECDFINLSIQNNGIKSCLFLKNWLNIFNNSFKIFML